MSGIRVMMETVDGWKAKALGALWAAISAAELVGVDVVADITPENAFTNLMLGLGVVAGRSAMKKLEPPQ